MKTSRNALVSVALDSLKFPGYIALKNGSILTVKRSTTPKILATSPHSKSGRMMVQMMGGDGKMHGVQLARLILTAFGRPSPAGRGYEPLHGNGDITDCRNSNLRWAKKSAPSREQCIKLIRGLMARYEITPDDLRKGK